MAFRVAFSLIVLWDTASHISKGWVRQFWIDPEYHFTYLGFGWVRPLPGDWELLPFAVICIACIGLLFGFYSQLSATIIAVTLTRNLLIDQAFYLNQHYAAALFALLLAIAPTRLLPDNTSPGQELRLVVERWWLWLIRSQVAVIHVFAGVAKLDCAWMDGSVAQAMIRASSIVGSFDDELIASFERGITVGGVVFNLLVVPALLSRRTFWLGVAGAVLFHMTNALLLNVGMLPWLMLSATTAFFDPSWTRGGGIKPRVAPTIKNDAPRLDRMRLLVTLYVAVQVAAPMRGAVYAGSASWTGEGQRFAWRMVLSSTVGDARFAVDTGNGRQPAPVPVRLTMSQRQRLLSHPDMMLQYAHILADSLQQPGKPRARVYLAANVSMNGGPSAPLVDSTIDIAALPRTLRHAKWLLPRPDPETLGCATAWEVGVRPTAIQRMLCGRCLLDCRE